MTAINQNSEEVPSFKGLTLFFIPLVILSFSQVFTYPLVAGIISHGPLGEQENAAYIIGQQVVSFLSSIGYGLVTTGMVYSTCKRGRINYLKLTLCIGVVAVIFQLLSSLSIFEDLIFRRLLGVQEPELRRIARYSILTCMPVQLVFYVRNVFTPILFKEKRSDLVNISTLVRIALAVPFSYFFIKYGLVGYIWGSVAMTIPCIVEALITWYFSRPYTRALPKLAHGAPPASIVRQFRFTLPLSLASMLATFTAFLATYYLSRSADPLTYRPIHFCALGLVAPFYISMLKMQTVTVAFAATGKAVKRIAQFALMSGLSLMVLQILLSLCRPFANWYFIDFQNLPEASVPLTILTVLVASFITIAFGFRGLVEGLSSIRHKSHAVLCGQIVYIIAYAGIAEVCTRQTLIPGYLWVTIAIILGSIFSAIATFVCMKHTAARP